MSVNDLIAVLSLCIGCFTFGYMVSAKSNIGRATG